MTATEQLVFTTTGGVSIAQLPSSVMSMSELADLRERWLSHVDEHPNEKQVVDFNKVLRYSSEAVGILIRVTQRLRSAGGDVKLCSMSDRTKQIFEICRLIPGTFQLYKSVGEAVESFQS